MSVSWFRIASPITYIQQVPWALVSNYTTLQFWIDNDSLGVLYFSEEHAPAILKLFALREDDTKCPMRTHYGGVGQGTVVTINDPNLNDADMLISSNGELLTVKEIKAKEGEGKEL